MIHQEPNEQHQLHWISHNHLAQLYQRYLKGEISVVGSTKVLKPESFILLNRIKKLKKYQ